MPDNEKERKINLVKPDGGIVAATPEQAKRLTIFGYREETEEERHARGVETNNESLWTTQQQKLTTFGEGVVSGASFGLLDPAITTERTQHRAAHNPGLRIAGELTGGLAVSLPGGAGIAKAAGGGIKGAVAAGAAEGFVAGGGSALTQSSLTGDPLTASSVLAHAGAGALLGAGVGLAAESLISGAGKLKRGLDVPEFTPGISTNSADDTLSSFYTSLPKEKGAKTTVPAWVRESADETSGFVTRTESSVGRYAPFQRGIRDVIDTTKIVEKDFEAVLTTARTQNKEYLRSLESTAADLNAAVRSTRKGFRELAESDAEKVAIDAEFRGLEDAYKTLRTAMKTDDPVKALNKVERFKDAIKSNPNFRGANGGALAPTPDSKTAVKLRDTIAATEEMLGLKAAARELKSMPATADEFFKMKAPKAERLFAAMDAAAKNTEFRKSFDGIDNFLEDLGVARSGSPGERARAAWEVGKVRTKFNHPEIFDPGFSENPAYYTSTTKPGPPTQPPISESPVSGTYFGKKPSLSEFEPEFQNPTFTSKGKTNYMRSGFWGKVIRMGGARQSSQIARHLGGGAFGSALAYESGAGITGMLLAGVAGAKMSAVSRISGAVAKYGGGLGRGLKRLAPRIEPLAVRIDGTFDEKANKKDKRDLLKQRTDEIMQASPRAKDASFMAIMPLVGIHPEFAKSLHDAFNTAFQGLLQFLPRDPGVAFSRLKTLWKPTDIQVVQAQKAYAVFHDPLGTIEAILDTGYSDTITVAALKAMYPPLYNELQYRVTQRMMEPGFLESLSYTDQARLSILSGVDIHSSFSSRSIAQTQMMYQRASENRPAPTTSGQGNSSGNTGRPAKQEPPTASQSLL